MGPCLGLGKVRGGGEGPGQVRAGGPLEALRKCLLGVGRNSALGTRLLAFARASESGGFYSKTRGEALLDRTKARGTRRTRLDGDQRGTDLPVGSTRA